MASNCGKRASSSKQAAAAPPKKSPNQEIVDMLVELGEYERNVTKQIQKFKAYQKAAATIRVLDRAVTSGAEAKKLPGIGVKIAKKIDEFLATGKLARLDMVRSDETNNAMKDLSRVSGIGPVVAAKFMREGIKSVGDLRKHPEKLNHHQRIGLQYLTEFESKIPRSEMELLEAVMRNELKLLDGQFTVIVCGSYRRGAAESSDIDVLVTHPKCTSANKSETGEYLARVASRLTEVGFITDSLTRGETMFMAVCTLSDTLLSRLDDSSVSVESNSDVDQPPSKRSKRVSTAKPTETQQGKLAERRAACTIVDGAFLHRRIDIRFVPADQYYCALVHFTGNDIFNRRIRSLAIELGYSLNEYAIRRVGSTGKHGEILPVNSEQDIFDYVGLPYCKPEERLA